MKTRNHVVRISYNAKTGPMSVTRTTTDTCPKSCPLLDNGCYDQGGNGNIHRTKVDAGKYSTLDFDSFIKSIRGLSSVYRHNEGGDLWSGKTSEHIDPVRLKAFVKANKKWKRKAIIYTHKAMVGSRDSASIRKANRDAVLGSGSTTAINTSVESLKDVDEAIVRGLDAACVLPSSTSDRVTRTPKNNRVVTCPAYYSKIQCVNCGNGDPLCLRKDRGYAIGFPAHGLKKKSVTLNVLN